MNDPLDGPDSRGAAEPAAGCSHGPTAVGLPAARERVRRDRQALDAARSALSDAETAFDEALAQYVSMPQLRQLDHELALAANSHRDAEAATRRSTELLQALVEGRPTKNGEIGR